MRSLLESLLVVWTTGANGHEKNMRLEERSTGSSKGSVFLLFHDEFVDVKLLFVKRLLRSCFVSFDRKLIIIDVLRICIYFPLLYRFSNYFTLEITFNYFFFFN